MNQSQIDQVKGHIDSYYSIDLSELLANAYSDHTDLNEAKIGEYTAKEFLSISNKVFNQFREELQGSYIKALPFQYNFHNEYANGNLHQDLSSYIANINASNFAAALTHLHRLVHYQAINGFWEKSKRKYFRAAEASLSEEQDRIDLASKHLQKVSEDLNKFIESVQLEKESLSNFTLAKKKELTEIESLLVASRQHNAEITDLHTAATSLIEKINSLLETTDEKKDESEVLLREARTSSKELLEIIKAYTSEIEKQNKTYLKLENDFNSKLSFVEDKKEYFEERNSYLNDLIEREVGASLFETFKQRKKELAPSVRFWKWSVPVTVIATIAWIFFLFGNGSLEAISYQIIIINSLKALPAIGLLLFSISQYTKERQYQEEYAFKSAVALTVNSYADQLQVPANKDNLIMNAVSSIYKNPVITTRSKDSKSISEATKELLDVAKSVLPKK